MVFVDNSVDVSKPVKGVPKPVLAYVLYGDEGGFTGATKHKISDDTLGLGRVVTLNYLANEFENAGNVRGGVELLPESVFLNNKETVGWISKAEMRTIWFNVTGKRRGFKVWWPNLVYLADRNKHNLRVFAAGSGKRPNLGSRLYHAPLMNIDEKGNLCAGSARLPRSICLETIEQLQACVTDSCFTHENHDETIRGVSSNSQHVGFWRKKEKNQERVRVKELNYWGSLAEALKQ